MYPYRLRIAAFLLAVGSFAWDASVAAASGGEAGRLQLGVQDGVLGVDASEVRLDRLLRAIGEQAGFEVSIDGDPVAQVTGSVAGWSVGKAIRRLLEDWGFLIISDGAGEASRLTRVHVRAGAERATFRGRAQPQVRVVEDSSKELESWIRSRLISTERGTRIVAVRRLARLDPEVAIDIATQILRFEDDPVVRGQTAAILG